MLRSHGANTAPLAAGYSLLLLAMLQCLGCAGQSQDLALGWLVARVTELAVSRDGCHCAAAAELVGLAVPQAPGVPQGEMCPAGRLIQAGLCRWGLPAPSVE